MFAPVRVVATIVFLGSIGLVFVGAFVLGNDVRGPSSSFYYPCVPCANYILRIRVAFVHK